MLWLANFSNLYSENPICYRGNNVTPLWQYRCLPILPGLRTQKQLSVQQHLFGYVLIHWSRSIPDLSDSLKSVLNGQQVSEKKKKQKPRKYSGKPVGKVSKWHLGNKVTKEKHEVSKGKQWCIWNFLPNNCSKMPFSRHTANAGDAGYIEVHWARYPS